MFSVVKPFQYVALRLPSDHLKIEQIVPNTHINLGKYGSFNTNCVIGRPFHLTFEILDKSEQSDGRYLRVVKAAELHADTLLEQAESDLKNGSAATPEVDGPSLLATIKSNAAIFDSPDNQRLTMAEIEALKADETGNAKELIARLLASHSQLEQKTAFSLAKYTIRKQKKYMKRFAILPLDVMTLCDWFFTEKDFGKVMEIRNEALGLIGSWANVHAAGEGKQSIDDVNVEPESQSRYLIVDDTGGLIVAAMAERMGILYNTTPSTAPQPAEDEELAETEENEKEDPNTTITTNGTVSHSTLYRRHKQHYQTSLATSNTLTLIHSNQQPNLSLLRYFNFDPNLPPSPSTPNPHPLYQHLKYLSWLQLVDPESDNTYAEPPVKSQDEIRSMKSNTRSAYYRKRRRWERCKSIVDETKAGGFNGLVIASYTNPISILNRLVPLLAGGAQIVLYSPHIEPLLSVADAYSTAHRAAYLNTDRDERTLLLGTSQFPVDPTLTLGWTVQTARVRPWQVLPGRTHPLMMSKGGAEGYIATATRVLPVQGKIEARGKPGRSKVRKTGGPETGSIHGNSAEYLSLDSSDEAEAGDRIENGERKKRARTEEVAQS